MDGCVFLVGRLEELKCLCGCLGLGRFLWVLLVDGVLCLLCGGLEIGDNFFDGDELYLFGVGKKFLVGVDWLCFFWEFWLYIGGGIEVFGL